MRIHHGDLRVDPLLLFDKQSINITDPEALRLPLEPTINQKQTKQSQQSSRPSLTKATKGNQKSSYTTTVVKFEAGSPNCQ